MRHAQVGRQDGESAHRSPKKAVLLHEQGPFPMHVTESLCPTANGAFSGHHGGKTYEHRLRLLAWPRAFSKQIPKAPH